MILYLIRLNNFIGVVLLIFINFEQIFSINEAFIKTIEKDSFSDSTKAAKMVIKIMKVCHRDDLDNIVLAGDWDDFQIWHDSFPSSLSFKIYGISQKKVHKQYERASGAYKLNETIVKKLYYPAKLFVISTRDHYFLQKNLEILKKSIVWNSRAFFIVIEKFYNHTCSNVTLSIETLWEINIINAIYLCNGSEENINFYNFNPYTTHGVKPWELMDKIIDKDRNHTLSIFHFATSVKNFKAPLCGLLNFEKTRKIDNYPIKLSASINPPMFENISVLKNQSFLNDFDGMDVKIHEIIWTKLDANPTIDIYNEGYIDRNHMPHGSVKEVIDGMYDMGVNQYFSRNFWRLQTYPHRLLGMYAVSLQGKPNVDSTLIISEPVIFVVLILISLFTIIGLKYYLKMNITQAFESSLKLLLGIPVKYVGSGGKKMFLVYLTVVAFIGSIFLQSSLSSSLVLPKDIFLIDSRDDLLLAVSLKYQVFCHPIFTVFLDDNITENLHHEGVQECIEKLHVRSKSVCVFDKFAINYFANGVDDIHISKQKIITWDNVFIVSEDWPLRTRVDFLIQQLRESGIINRFVRNQLSAAKAHHAALKPTKEHGQSRDLSLKSLDFSMYILFVGLFIALSVFVAEQIRMRCYRQIGKNGHKLDNLNIFKQSRA